MQEDIDYKLHKTEDADGNVVRVEVEMLKEKKAKKPSKKEAN